MAIDRTVPQWLLTPWLFGLLAVLLYANTIGNQFALDDGLVLNDNAYVLKGIAGIPDILTHDSFHGAVGETDKLSGGRYRPLSLVTLAVEVSLFGVSAAVHHGVNVLLFALTCVVLFRFLRRFIFPQHVWAAWCTTMLFTVHPIHTEVVANIKGRDELLSLLFLLLTMYHALANIMWREQRDLLLSAPTKRKKEKKERLPGEWSDVISVLFFVLALLSKENGLIFIALLPLTNYFFTPLRLPAAIRRSLPVISVVVLYLVLRVVLLGARNNAVQEVMDNPYLFASVTEKLASIAVVMLIYLKLMVWPHPLVYDYSFNQVPLHALADPLVWISLAVQVGLLVYAVIGFRRKDPLAWCILFWFGTLFLVCNLVFNVGAPLAERFLYQASVPFLIAVVIVLRRVMARLKDNTMLIPALSVLLILITTSSGYAIFLRNGDWQSGDHLFIHDVRNAPNSGRARTYAGIAYIHLSDSAATTKDKRAYADSAIVHLTVAERIHPTYMPTLLNMGLAYYRLDSIETAERWWDKARAVDPNDGKLEQLDAFLFDRYYQGGLRAGLAGDLASGRTQLEKAVKYAPLNADAWYNLGGVHYTSGDLDNARNAWAKALELNPAHAQTLQGMRALEAAGGAVAP
ncbi:MAG TPA: tetratricopeptide repeat protein [Flavobacteriales bacterium]|nr:tetratricopeptide repeat protein [Flavobacteriales bacterium]HQV74962.1 tetratricopeptide repeat protein [Flavobacteriales bacterium]